MKKMQQLAALAVVAVTLVTPSLFADSRHRETTYARDGRGRHAREFAVEGRIRSIERERNGFVIRLRGRDELLFAPVQTRVYGQASRRGRERVRDLERGDVIRATVRGESRGVLAVSAIDVLRSEDHRDDRNDRWIHGVVYDVDRNSIQIREERSGRMIRVDMREVSHRTIRRGDRVRIRGDWERNGRFEAEAIEVASRSRY